MDELLKQLQKLQAENETLKSKLNSQEEKIIVQNEKITVQNEKITSLEKLTNWYEEQLKLRQKEKFGTSSEKSNDDQMTFFDLFNEVETLKEPIMVDPGESILVPTHTRKKSKRGSKFDSLPVEVIEYKLEDDEKTCDVCSSELTEMKKEVRKELKLIPAKVMVVEHVTYVYSCRSCDKEGVSGFIKKADSPKALIPKSMVSPSILAHILNQKYTNAMPLYRQEQEFKRYGIDLNRQTLSYWMLKGAGFLKPLVEAMKQELFTNDLLHADETTLEVLHEPGRPTTAKSYMWLYRTSECANNPVIMYDYQVGRSGTHAKTFLKDWNGTYLHCDGYSGYKQLEGITLCGCLVHAKRKFHEAWKVNESNTDAKQGEAYIQKLFAIEAKADKLNLTVDERFQLRNTESKVVLDEFYTWINSVSTRTLPQSLLGKAITYAQNQKQYLTNFLKDGRIQLSNNLAEQSIKML